MKKRIFAIIALAATLAGCSKEVSENPSPVVEGQKLVITATVGEPATRLGYTENDKNGFTAKFTSSEKISLYFLKADNTVALSRTLSVDSYSISEDGKSAKFETTDLTIPSDAVKLAAYLYSGSGSTYTDEKVTDDLSTQANLNAAQSHHILYAAANTSDIKTGEDGVAVANLKFAYKTALLRFTLTLPEGVKATLDDKTKVTLSTPDNSVHNALDIVWGELAESSVKGDIVAYPTDTVKVGNVAVVYACVWAADNFKDSKIAVAQGDDTYSVNLELKKETLEAGKVYDVKRTLTAAPVPVAMWTNDEAGSADFKYSGGEDLTNDWLSCKSGKVSWSANTTGAPRSAKLTFKNGATFELCQVEAKDLAGNYTFYNYSFKSAGVSTTTAGANRKHETAVQIKAVENPQTVNGHVHNIDIVGLYLDFALPASFEVVDGVPSVYTYLSLDYQTLNNGTEVACIPELTNTAAYGTGYFAPVSFGVDNCNYAWIAWGVDDLFGTSKFTVGTGEQRFVSENRYCCGFSFNLKGYSEGGYTTIYQFNYNNSWTYTGTAGAYFCKK